MIYLARVDHQVYGLDIGHAETGCHVRLALDLRNDFDQWQKYLDEVA
jgi:hypothetical protein